MIVPIASVGLTLIFLLLTILLSRRNHIPAFKSSVLAFALSLDPDVRKEMGGLRLPAVMEARAKEQEVRLENAGGEWQIVRGG